MSNGSERFQRRNGRRGWRSDGRKREMRGTVLCWFLKMGLDRRNIRERIKDREWRGRVDRCRCVLSKF